MAHPSMDVHLDSSRRVDSTTISRMIRCVSTYTGRSRAEACEEGGSEGKGASQEACHET
jgi:hypothetical protein